MKRVQLKRLLYNRFFICFLLILIVSGAFSPIIKNDFLYFWDDQWVVINDYTQGGYSLNNLWAILTEFYHGQYAPLNELNYIIIYSLFGYDPFWFHLVSFFWHIANVILVYLFVLLLLDKINALDNRSIGTIAFYTAFLFGIHPLTVESTAWVSASKVLIYSFFYLLALLSYIQYLNKNKIRYYIYTLILFFLSFLGKEQAVTLPLCLLLIDWFFQRNLKDKNLWFEKLPFFTLAIFFGFITILSQEGGGNAPQYPFFQRGVLSFYTLFEYLVKTIFPFKLSYIYPFPMQVGEAIPTRFFIYPVIVLFLVYIIYLFRKNRVLVFSVLFFVTHLSVAINIISTSRFSIVADRYAYLAIVGIMFLITYHVISLTKEKRLNKMVLLLLLLYGVYLGIYTHTYSKQWKGTVTLKKHLRELLKQRKDAPVDINTELKQFMK